MPSEAKKAEYNANKKKKRHDKKWQDDPKTQALQAEMRQVRATGSYDRAASAQPTPVSFHGAFPTPFGHRQPMSTSSVT